MALCRTVRRPPATTTVGEFVAVVRITPPSTVTLPPITVRAGDFPTRVRLPCVSPWISTSPEADRSYTVALPSGHRIISATPAGADATKGIVAPVLGSYFW